MTIADLLALTRQRIGAIILGLVIGIVAAGGYLALTPVTYQASSTAYVRVAMPDSQNQDAQTGQYYQASQLASQKVKAFVPVFTSQVVAQGVIDALGLDMTPAALAARTSASNEVNSLTIKVSAEGDSPEQAQTIADETVRQGAKQVKALEGQSSPVEVVLMSSSALAEPVRSPSVAKIGAVGVLGGLVLGYGLAFLRALLDRKIRTTADIASALEAPVLGSLPVSKDVDRWGQDRSDGAWRVEESLRKLRTNLRYTRVDGELGSVLVSSSVQGEGKSTVAKNLARVMALAGRDVVLVEADLRRPVVAERFGIRAGQPGLSQLLLGAVSLDDVLWPTGVEGLSVIPAGDTPPNPSELLGSERMAELIRYLAQDHVVVLDGAPVLPVTDSVSLSRVVDGVLLVASAGSTTTDQVRMASEQITQAGGHVLGTALNRVKHTGLDRLKYGETEYAYTADGYHRDGHGKSGDKSMKRDRGSRVPAPGGARHGSASAAGGMPPSYAPAERGAEPDRSTAAFVESLQEPAGDQAQDWLGEPAWRH